MNTIAQNQTWTRFDRLMKDGSYKSAYELAEGVYRKDAASADRLAAAYHMAIAAAAYQEDARDSAEARYRELLPQLEPLEQALCHAFLDEYDQALEHSDVLRQTPVGRIRMYCDGQSVGNITPTAYDVVVRAAIDHYATTQQRRLDLQRSLIDFHANDGDDIRIWLRRELLDMMASAPNVRVGLAEWQQAIEDFRGAKSPLRTLLYLRAAQCCNDGEDYVQALCYCDTAVRMAPKSEGGVACANLAGDIKQRQVSLDDDGFTVAPGVPSLQRVRYRNTNVLSYRVVPYMQDYRWNDKAKQQLLSATAVASGTWRVTPGLDYRYAESYITLPPLAAGHWLLLVAPATDFRTNGFMAYEMHCTDMLLIDNQDEGMLLDRRTGRPIVGQQVRVERKRYNDTPQVLSTTVTDRNGRYRLTVKDSYWNDQIVVERDGFRLQTRYSNGDSKPDTAMKLRVELRTDRPVYKPGDTLHVALIAYYTDGLEARAANGTRMQIVLQDPNWQEVETSTPVTDDFGTATACFVVPTDRIAGAYRLMVGDLASVTVRVEEYKQPRFMVTLGESMPQSTPAVAAAFGSPYTVQGLAASYSAVPIGGARVQYTVSREACRYFWWRHWSPFGEAAEVVSGETTTAADGSFSIVFVPEPDSTVELEDKPAFFYTIVATVTDLNGESHEAVTRLRIGYRNAFVGLGNRAQEVAELRQLQVTYEDLNERPLAGTVSVKVERLRQPDVPLLDAPLLQQGTHHSQTEADWHRDFPLLAYDDTYNNKHLWPVERVCVREETVVADGEGTVDLPQLPSGTYRITLAAADADTVVEHITLTLPEEKKAQSQELLWSDVDRTTVEVGDNLRLRVGSRFANTEVCYLLRIGNEERIFRRFTLDDEIIAFDITVDSTMLGGFTIDLVTVREGIERHIQHKIAVPFSHKQLAVEARSQIVGFSSFRDKLLPGEQEEWTLRVQSAGRGVQSVLIMTMYDDALNSYYGKPDWSIAPWRVNSGSYLTPLHFGSGSAHWLNDYKHLNYSGTSPSWYTLKDALPYYRPWYGRRMYKSARAANSMVQYETILADEEEVALDMAMPMAVSTSVAEDASVGVATGADRRYDAGGEEPQVRTNLNTLAFFAPAIQTDADGTATYRFTVPELLTRWNVRGLALTDDMKTGTLDKTLVTAKPLMVQPNMPRFLRQGDSLSLMAKVVLNDEELKNKNEELPVEVSFVLTDAATGDTLCHQTEQVTVDAVGQVMFDVEVPQHVYVATYRIVARAEGMSDGEQGQVPVVSNRQAVTVSQALYLNGAGEKRFAMPEWMAGSASREPRLVGAELTGNPVWLAVKCMPYLKNLENPSTPYLANQLYVNSLGRDLMDRYDITGNLVRQELLLDNKSSRLRLNEDVKQTLLQATPWVGDADSEEEQMRAVADFFDPAALDAERNSLAARLAERQNGDGGWSWMPEGESSLWVTQQVLKRIEGLNLDIASAALAYADAAQQRHYDRYIKPYLKKGYKWEATDIDYLYTRSFYGTATTEAYKFYYANALKNYRDYENLYTQAQLALIFHRHGDRKAAQDLLRRLKEKALTGDEMGMYWRDNQSSWWWYRRPIETQALIIQAFSECAPDDRAAIGLMQQWLLKQKQTTHWGSDVATVEAIRALTVGSDFAEAATRSDHRSTTLTVFGHPVTAAATGLEGYTQQRWTGTALDTLRASADDAIVLASADDGIAWGAVYYQFADDMDKIPASDMGVTVRRTYTPAAGLRVGDRVRVRIDIQCDRAMEYLELIDGRPSCVEPLSTTAGWRWNDGLSYYIVVGNTDTRCYIDHLDKGKYYFEYEVFITNPGSFLCGPVTIQCMYAPEFRATSPAVRLQVAE